MPNFVTLQKCFFLLGKPQKLPFENKKYFTLKNLSTYYGHITLRFGLSVGIFTGLLQYLSKDIISFLQNPFPAILRPKKSPDCNSAQITFFLRLPIIFKVPMQQKLIHLSLLNYWLTSLTLTGLHRML